MTIKKRAIIVMIALLGFFASSISAFAAHRPGAHHGPQYSASWRPGAANSKTRRVGISGFHHGVRYAARRAHASHRYAGHLGHGHPIALDTRGVRQLSASRIADAVSTEGAQWTGAASYYGGSHRTASGGFVGAATCAHRTLPFGTKVLVTNLQSGRQAVLTVNDRGPFVHGRIVDVSTGAASMLGMIHAGVAQVRVQVIASASRVFGGG